MGMIWLIRFIMNKGVMMSGQEYKDLLDVIRRDMMNGVLTYEEAKEKAQPIIDEMNELARGIAKKYGKKHQDFTFSKLMR